MSPADSPFAPPSAPGPHPATAELRAYAAGTLAPADEHRIEAHALDCERCTELLDGFSVSNAAATDEALATLRARLQARVGSDLALPATAAASRPLWPRLAAAVALLGAIGAGLWGWEHQPTAEHTVAVRTPMPRPAAPADPAETAATAAPETAVADAAVVAAAPAAPVAQAKPSEAAAEYAAVVPRRQRVLRASVTGPVSQSESPDLSEMPATGTNISGRAADMAAAPMTDSRRAALTREPSAAKVASTAAPAESREAEAARDSAAEFAVPARRALRPAAGRVSSAVATSIAADSVLTERKEVLVAASKAKAANAPAALLGNSVRVLDKPMPAAPAIAPAPLGGTPALKEYLRREAAEFEPEENARSLPGGSVKVRFVVGADGQVSNLQVVRGLRADYDAEALRIICEGPAWRPGIANGRRAALPMELTVSF